MKETNSATRVQSKQNQSTLPLAATPMQTQQLINKVSRSQHKRDLQHQMYHFHENAQMSSPVKRKQYKASSAVVSQIETCEVVGPPKMRHDQSGSLMDVSGGKHVAPGVHAVSAGPVTPINVGSAIRNFNVGLESGVVQPPIQLERALHSNYADAGARGTGSVGMPSSVAQALNSTSGNRQALVSSISHHKHKSIDEYKTQISNQIKSIKASAVGHFSSPQQTLAQQKAWQAPVVPNFHHQHPSGVQTHTTGESYSPAGGVRPYASSTNVVVKQKMHLDDGYQAQRSSLIGKTSDRDQSISSPQPFEVIHSGSSTKKDKKSRDRNNERIFDQSDFVYEPHTSASAPNGALVGLRRLDDEDMSPDVRFHQVQHTLQEATHQTSGSTTLHSFLPNIEKKSMQENHNFVGRSPPPNAPRKTILIGNNQVVMDPRQQVKNSTCENVDSMLRTALMMDGASRSGERNHSNLRNFDAATAAKSGPQHQTYLRTMAQGQFPQYSTVNNNNSGARGNEISSNQSHHDYDGKQQPIKSRHSRGRSDKAVVPPSNLMGANNQQLILQQIQSTTRGQVGANTKRSRKDPTASQMVSAQRQFQPSGALRSDGGVYERATHLASIKDKQERQLDDLNETLQRLAREKYTKNVPGGAGGMQGSSGINKDKKRGGRHNDLQVQMNNQYQIQLMQGMEMDQMDNSATGTQRREKKKRSKAKQSQQQMMHDAAQQKRLEQQKSALIIGDALVNQRLQGVKQGEMHKQNRSPAPHTVKPTKLKGVSVDQGRQAGSQNLDMDGNSFNQQMSIMISNEQPIVLKNVNIVGRKDEQGTMLGQMDRLSPTGNAVPNLQRAARPRHIDASQILKDSIQRHYQTTSGQEGFDHGLATNAGVRAPMMTAAQTPNQGFAQGTAQYTIDLKNIQTPLKKLEAQQQTYDMMQRIVGRYDQTGPQSAKAAASAVRLQLGQQQFSSVIEDVELEQLHSPHVARKRAGVSPQPRHLPLAQLHRREDHSMESQLSSVGPGEPSGTQSKQMTKEEIITQIRRLHDNPQARRSGIQLIKCEASQEESAIRSREQSHQHSQRGTTAAVFMGSEPGSIDDEQMSEQNHMQSRNLAMQLDGQHGKQSQPQYKGTGDSAVFRSVNNLKLNIAEGGLAPPHVMRMNETTRHNMQNSGGIRKTVLEKDGTQVVSNFQLIAAMPPVQHINSFSKQEVPTSVNDELRQSGIRSSHLSQQQVLAGVPEHAVNMQDTAEASIAGSDVSSHRAAALQGGSLRQSLASFDYRNRHAADSARAVEVEIQQRLDKSRGTHHPAQANHRMVNLLPPDANKRFVMRHQTQQLGGELHPKVHEETVSRSSNGQRSHYRQVRPTSSRGSDNLRKKVQETGGDHLVLPESPDFAAQQTQSQQPRPHKIANTPRHRNEAGVTTASIRGDQKYSSGRRAERTMSLPPKPIPNAQTTGGFRNSGLMSGGPTPKHGGAQTGGNSPIKRDKPTLQLPPRRTDSRNPLQQPHSMTNQAHNTIRIPSPQNAPVDDGYVSSDAPEAALNLKLGTRVPRENFSFCSEYVQLRGQYTKRMPKELRYLFTRRRYFKNNKRNKDGDLTTINVKDAQGSGEDAAPSQFTWSQRLYLSRECAASEDRRRLPVLIINMDGFLGYWDDSRRYYYVLRPKAVEGLIQLSYDFRLVAVSSQRAKHICKVIQALMNISPTPEVPANMTGDASNHGSLKHLVFDAVYQLRTQNEDTKYLALNKNIDEIHFDLSQVLLDMQFKPHKKPDDKKNTATAPKADVRSSMNSDRFLTFWETETYRPQMKVMILTTDRHLYKSHCYSFDYNYLYQAFKFRHEQSKKAPVVIQVQHLRMQPKLSFEPILQLIFGMQHIAIAQACAFQPSQKLVNDQLYINPDTSPFEVCKKVLSARWRSLIQKMRKTTVVKGLRSFDQNENPFVDLELINFGKAYTYLKKFYEDSDRQSDWLRVKKYYLQYQAGKEPVSPQKIKQNLKVTFEESPDIRRIGEHNDRDKASSSLRAAATTHDSSKSDRFSIAKTHFISEDAKNHYNGLMIRNFKIQQEINSYARHFRIQTQMKLDKKKREDREAAQQEAEASPIVIYDGDDHEQPRPQLKSSLKQSTLKRIVEEAKAEKMKEKKYAFKFRVVQVRIGDPIEDGDVDISKHQVVNLRLNPMYQALVKVPGGGQQQTTSPDFLSPQSLTPRDTSVMATSRQVTSGVTRDKERANQDYRFHTVSGVLDEMKKDKAGPGKNALIELLSKRQTKISYSTNQEMHLKNNLNQLVEGEQQYKDQQQQLMENERGAANESINQGGGQTTSRPGKETQQDYINKI